MNGSHANIKYGLQFRTDTTRGIVMSPITHQVVTGSSLNPFGSVELIAILVGICDANVIEGKIA
jgi:hypothetical protein